MSGYTVSFLKKDTLHLHYIISLGLCYPIDCLQHLFTQVLTMSAQLPRRNRRKPVHNFPSDPRYTSMTLQATASEMACLGREVFLSTAVLDCIIQCTALPPDVSKEPVPPMIASLGAMPFISSSNVTASLKRQEVELDEVWNGHQNTIFNLRRVLAPLLNPKPPLDLPQRLIVPVVEGAHFFVGCFDFSVRDPDFFVDISFYDSLQRSRKRLPKSSTPLDIVRQVNHFFNTYLIHEENFAPLRQTDASLLRRVQYKECPEQTNGFDCGIFAVAIVLHLSERIEVKMDSFSQADVTKGRSQLAEAFCLESAVMTSDVFRNCFPCLCGRSIIESTGVEVITRVTELPPKQSATLRYNIRTRSKHIVYGGDGATPHSAITFTSPLVTDHDTNAKHSSASVSFKKRHHNKISTGTGNGSLASAKNDEEVLFDPSPPRPDLTTTTSTISTTASMNLDTDNDSRTTDTALYRIMEEQQLESFKDLNDVSALIDSYESQTGNRLRIQKSLKDRFRVYHCCVHVDCPFQVRFSKRRSDGLYVIKKLTTKHSTVLRPTRAADGRHLKKRRQGRLDDVVVRVFETKNGVPTPGDVVKTAGTKNNMSVPYQVAYRALTNDTLQQKKSNFMNFQLIVPYLEAMRKGNPDSVIGYTRRVGFEMVDLHFFPNFVNEVLSFVRPVISLDAAHLRSEYKGMLYIASVLSGNNDIYPIGFMIATGNEDKKTWIKMLRLLKLACPIISTPKRGPFIFVSDRDKGLKPALKEVFPDNIEMSCAKHIEANVTQKFGKECGRHVMTMAKTYSVRYYNQVLDLIQTSKSEAAAKYVSDITRHGVLWTNSQWTDSNLPPRFGIVTSNTSESLNSMFNSARDLPWMDAVEKIVDLMLTRICTCRTKYRQHDDIQIVPRAEGILKKRWEATASISVMELEEGSGVFNTSTCEYGGEGGNANAGLPLQRQSSHIVKLVARWCSCGVWQDTLLPCKHACAVFRKWKEADFNYILANLVDAYYTYGFVKMMFKRNIYPVGLDTLAYDGETKPPVSTGRSTGRPKKKMLRRRSKFAASEDSPIICSNCGAPGHNKRTCTATPRDLLSDRLLSTIEEPEELLSNGEQNLHL